MINRVFFVTEHIYPSVRRLSAEEGIYNTIRVNPASGEDLERIYREMDGARPENVQAYREMENAASGGYSLTLDIREPLTADALRFITSFLFIPAYLRIGEGRVINLTGASDELLQASMESLSDYLSGQGIGDAVLNKIPHFVDSPEALILLYSELLRSDRPYDNDIFFLAPSPESLKAALSSLKQAEADFERADPVTFALILRNSQLEREISLWRKRQEVTEAELSHQKQFVEVLRSDHATKELQDFYNNEYEILPLWYKRFGHLIKVVTGKRTLRSLFNDNVKKYKS
jgi:hypothetical protein